MTRGWMSFRGPSVAVAAATVALFAVGCGSSSSTSGTGGGSTTPASTNAGGSSSTPATQTGTGSTSFSSAGGCGQLKDMADKFAHEIQQSVKGKQPDLQAVADDYKQLANDAPSQIQQPLQGIADAMQKYVTALKDAGITTGSKPSISQLPKLESALSSFQNAGVVADGQKIEAWVKTNCES